MKILKHPVPTTILWGLVCGIGFIPLNRVLSIMLLWPSAFCLTLWLFSAGYALLLSYWSNTKIMPSAYPLIVLFMAALLVKSVAAFFLLALAVISWIRSGICFQAHSGIKLAVEMLLCAVAGALINVYKPGTTFAWALAIWMFFLVQALYFVVIDGKTLSMEKADDFGIDPFERASRRAADILSVYGK
jgi:hypothetical protein